MNKKIEWENSYLRKENLLFYPSEEVIRFISKYVRKQISRNKFIDIESNLSDKRILDLGCGIGRHVIYCNQMGLNAYGIDLSNNAIDIAVNWAENDGMMNSLSQIIQGDITELPWDDNFYQYAISHGVLDSMPFDIARQGCNELARVMKKNGLFYCDLKSRNNSLYEEGDSTEEVVERKPFARNPEHETGTIQSYFNLNKINELIDGFFSIQECMHIKKEEKLSGDCDSRFHLVLKNIKVK